MAKKRFLRGDWMNYSKLGRKRKKKQKYRRPRGIHNKIRLKMAGHSRKVQIGYKKAKKDEKKEIKTISNINELLKMKRDDRIILARIGRKKKIEVARKAKELGIRIENLKIENFLKKIEKLKSGKQEKGKENKGGKAGKKDNGKIKEENRERK